MLISICQSLCTIKRRTNECLTTSSVASSFTITSSPLVNCSLSFIFSIAQSGTVTVTGTDSSGSSQTENIILSSNKIAASSKIYKTITTIELDSSIVSAGGTVKVKYIGADGGSVSSQENIVTNFPVRISRSGGSLMAPASGTNQKEAAKALLPYTEVFSPKDGDLLILNETQDQFLISGSPFIEMIGFNSHWVASLERYSNS